MKKILIIIFQIIFLTTGALKGITQEQCATDYMHRQMMQIDSAYKTNYFKIQEQIKSILQNRPLQEIPEQIYMIPVVVHVIHLGEPVGVGTNVSDVQIQNAIINLNNRFRNIIGSGIDTEIEFCLASRDPTGCPTNGINRANGGSVSNYSSLGIRVPGCGIGANEDSVKSLSRWPVLSYYNIWVVNKICNGQFSGWAYYPFGGVNDGTVIAFNYMTETSTLLTHELGHGFDLRHTFEGDGGNLFCPIDTNCVVNGDLICDTPPHKQGDCGTTNPCTNSGIWNNSKNNYLSYCSALDRFTSNQKDRMRATLLVNPRAQLLVSQGCSAGSPPPPQPGPVNGSNTICKDSTQTYSVSPVSGAISYTWTLPAGWTGSSTTNSIQATAGSNSGTISVKANNSCGSSTNQTLPVTVNQVPAQPGTITGNVSVITGQTLNYSINIVNGATGYNWSLNGGGNITTGQNTPLISINWGSQGNYTLSVNAVNACGTSSNQTLNITVSFPTVIINPDNIFQIKIIPNPSPGEFYLTAKGLVNKEIRIEVLNMLGQIIYSSQQRVRTNDFTQLLNLRNAANSVYNVKIIIDKKTYLMTIIKID